MSKTTKPDFSKWAFMLSVVVIAFIAGAIFVKKKIPPYPFFANQFNQVVTLVEDLAGGLPELIRIKIDPEKEGMTQYEPERAFNGLTLIQGTFDSGVEIRLIDMDGAIVHRWAADFFEVWPQPDHILPKKNIPNGPFHYSTQGMWAFPDGSVIFNFTPSLGTVKLDRCGKVLWTIDRMTHHSITMLADGGFWVPTRTDIDTIDADLYLPGVTLDVLKNGEGLYEDRLLRVDGNGKVIREISVLKALFYGNVENSLYDAGRFYDDDPTHVNDIEVVTSKLADKIDGVEGGDLLVSIRNMHMLAILDQEDGSLKWHQIGPWVRQHDPDITEDGNIIVFNNGSKKLARNRVAGSNLIELDPATGQSQIIYPHNDDQAFFTAIMGTHQTLPNGNHLTTVSNAGRVFEISPGGELVWDFHQRFNQEYASNIDSAMRYPADYFQVSDWSCE